MLKQREIKEGCLMLLLLLLLLWLLMMALTKLQPRIVFVEI
jgi:hypothetical protein